MRDELPSGFDPSLGSLPDVPARAPAPPPPPTGPAMAPAKFTVCQVCAGTPIRDFFFGKVIGAIITWRREQVRGTFCRRCALSLGRDAQNATLAVGWFGVLPFFASIGTIGSNALELREAARLEDPGDGPHRLEPGRPVVLRFGMLVPLAAIAVIVAVLANSEAGRPDDDPETFADLAVGDCLDRPDQVVWIRVDVIDCADSHDLEVLAVIDGGPLPTDHVARAGELRHRCEEHVADTIGADLDGGRLELSTTRSLGAITLSSTELCLLGSADGSPLVGPVRDSDD